MRVNFEKVDFVANSVYYMKNTETCTSNGGERMAASEEKQKVGISKQLLDLVSKKTGITRAEAAEKIGWSPQRLNNRLSRNTLYADDFFEILDSVGIEVVLIAKETQEAIRFNVKGAGHRVVGMVNGVKYDTEKADAISNNFYADGVNEYQDGFARELYVDAEGKYFFAEYSAYEKAKDRIIPVEADIAADFIEKYGTELFKNPNIS